MKTIGSLMLLLAVLLAACAPAAASPVATEASTAPDTAIIPATPEPSAQPAGAGQAVSFATDIQPIFDNNCTRCHGGQNPRSELALTSYAALMAGGSHGPVIIAGDPDNSLLYNKVQSGQMPKTGTKLTAEQVQMIRDWISAGAPDN